MTLFTSDIEQGKRPGKAAFIYLLAAIFTALFGGIYERFSHEVYSYWMIYAFAFPLVGGTLPYMLPGVTWNPGSMYHAGIATLTVGSIVKGVLEIYGTTNGLTAVYWLAGGILTAVGVARFLMLKYVAKLT